MLGRGAYSVVKAARAKKTNDEVPHITLHSTLALRHFIQRRMPSTLRKTLHSTSGVTLHSTSDVTFHSIVRRSSVQRWRTGSVSVLYLVPSVPRVHRVPSLW